MRASVLSPATTPARARRIASKDAFNDSSARPARRSASAQSAAAASPSALGAAPSQARNARCNGSSANIQSPRATRIRPRQSASPAVIHRAASFGTAAPRRSRTSLHATDCCCSRPPRCVRTTMPAGLTLTMSPSSFGALPRSSTTSPQSGGAQTPSAMNSATQPKSGGLQNHLIIGTVHLFITADYLRLLPWDAPGGTRRLPLVQFAVTAGCPIRRQRRWR